MPARRWWGPAEAWHAGTLARRWRGTRPRRHGGMRTQGHGGCTMPRHAGTLVRTHRRTAVAWCLATPARQDRHTLAPGSFRATVVWPFGTEARGWGSAGARRPRGTSAPWSAGTTVPGCFGAITRNGGSAEQGRTAEEGAGGQRGGAVRGWPSASMSRTFGPLGSTAICRRFFLASYMARNGSPSFVMMPRITRASLSSAFARVMFGCPSNSSGVMETERESRGDVGQENGVNRSRRRRTATVTKAKPRNVRLSDDVHDRLWMLARQRRQSVSAVANDLLDTSLPRWVVKKEG
jgi:hypothetical protein